VSAEVFAGLATTGDAMTAVPIDKATRSFMQRPFLFSARTLREAARIVQRQADRRYCFNKS